MGITYKIEEQPEKVSKLLLAVENDPSLSNQLSREVGQHGLNGHFSSLDIFNKWKTGLVKTMSSHDQKAGNLSLKTAPSILFWVIFRFSLVVLFTSLYASIALGGIYFALTLLFFCVALGVIFLYYRDVSLLKGIISRITAE